jgi:hypothetical protein
MFGRRRIAPALLCLVLLAIGCDASRAPDAGMPLPAAVKPLLPSGVLQTCGGIAIPSVLAGNPNDPRVVWLVGFTDGRRTDVSWPDGYRAAFNPALRILSADGVDVLRGGDFVDGGCSAGDPALTLLPPFLAFRLDCGPMLPPECTGGRVHTVAKASGWPERAIASVRFTATDGQYEVTFEDGSRTQGVAADH